MRRNTTRSFVVVVVVVVVEALPASDTISSPKSDMPASEPFVSERTIEHSSNCEFLLKI